jgi:hypothetical protein
MHVIKANNINAAFAIGLRGLLQDGHEGVSRNGVVLRHPTPVTTAYTNPKHRVLFCRQRRPNPFFHVMESMWMLAGRNDLKFVSHYNARMATYSDDGATQPAAYGHRWVHHFEKNQILFVIDELCKNPDSRRATIGMWDPRTDIEAVMLGGADVPCNTNIYFIKRPGPFGGLDMTVTNRSNDAIWGAYGANAVHMSFLHELVSLATDIPMGTYYQVSNDLHAYTDVYSIDTLVGMSLEASHRSADYPNTVPLINLADGEDINDFIADLCDFFDTPPIEGQFGGVRTFWFDQVITPMYLSWEAYKRRDAAKAHEWAGRIQAMDWRLSCEEWLSDVKW